MKSPRIDPASAGNGIELAYVDEAVFFCAATAEPSDLDKTR